MTPMSCCSAYIYNQMVQGSTTATRGRPRWTGCIGKKCVLQEYVLQEYVSQDGDVILFRAGRDGGRRFAKPGALNAVRRYVYAPGRLTH
jgi:predicted hydrocarbon binding protein